MSHLPLSRASAAIFLVMLLAGTTGAVGPADAVRHPNDFYFDGPLSDGWFFGGDEDFLVVTILAVQDSGASHARPPSVSARVEEVLRGRYERGVRSIHWPPVPQFMPCPVGEGANIRRWQSTPMRGPGLGQRMILGGHMGADGVWVSDAMMRWNDDGSPEASEVRRKIREWSPSATARQRREAQARKDQARRDRIERERTEAEQARIERAWLLAERSIAADSDVDVLVRQSDAVVIAHAPRPMHFQGPWGGSLQVSAWMMDPTVTPGATSTIRFGREALRDSVARRWLSAPVDDAPGIAPGESLRSIAFVRFSHEPRSANHGDPRFRPVDPVRGFLLADSAVVRAARAAIGRRAGAPTELPLACGAPFHEFIVADTVEASGITVKLTPVASEGGSVVLACEPGWTPGYTAVHAGTFPPCAGSARLAADDHERHLQLQVRPTMLRALLDSLATVPQIVTGTFDPSDRLTLTLHRVIAGRERVFDATLDSASTAAVSRFLTSTFPEAGVARWNMPHFWGQVDPGLVAQWQEPVPVRRPSTPPPFAPSHDLPPDQASIFGMIVDEVSREPLPGFFIYTSRPRRTVQTNEDGMFVLPGLPLGTRGMLVHGPGHEPSYAEVPLVGGHLQPVAIRVARTDGPRSTPAIRSWTAPPFLLPELDAELAIAVRDEEGLPLENAYVRIERAGQQAAGFTDVVGIRRFRDLDIGPARIYVHAPGFRAVRLPTHLHSGLSGLREVVLRRETVQAMGEPARNGR